MGFEALLNKEMLMGNIQLQDRFEQLRRDIDWLQRALKLSPNDKTLQEEWAWKSREYDRMAEELGLTRVEPPACTNKVIKSKPTRKNGRLSIIA